MHQRKFEKPTNQSQYQFMMPKPTTCLATLCSLLLLTHLLSSHAAEGAIITVNDPLLLEAAFDSLQDGDSLNLLAPPSGWTVPLARTLVVKGLSNVQVSSSPGRTLIDCNKQHLQALFI